MGTLGARSPVSVSTACGKALGFSEFQCESVGLATHGRVTDLFREVVLRLVMEVSRPAILEAERQHFVDNRDRIESPAAVIGHRLIVARRMVDHAVNAAGLQGVEDGLVHMPARLGVEVVQIAECQNHVGIVDAERKRSAGAAQAERFGALERHLRGEDPYFVETGFGQQALFQPTGTYGDKQLAVFGQYRREQACVPAATGNQFDDTHVILEPEEGQRLGRLAIRVALGVGVWSRVGGECCGQFRVDWSGARTLCQHETADGKQRSKHRVLLALVDGGRVRPGRVLDCYTCTVTIRASLPGRIAILTVLAVWVWHYVSFYPAPNLLWTCNVGWIGALVGIALGNAWLVSLALLMSFVPDALWVVDVAGRLATGTHPIGGTEYLFDPDIPASVRLLSWEHAVLPALSLFATYRLGYRAEAFRWVLPLVLVVYYASYWLADPAWHVNYTRGLFGAQQTLLPDLWYPALAATVFWIALAGPVHLAARRWLMRR